MTAPSDGAEESAKQQEIVVRFLCSLSKFHGAVHYLVQVWLKEKEKRKNIPESKC